jgi:SHO1 osmosensor
MRYTRIDTANPEDNTELSFAKDEVMDIADNKGKWWHARKADGSIGVVPSNYLELMGPASNA